MNAAYLTPAITLFNEDGTLDLASQERLFNNLIDQGVDGILVEGSSSEFFAMPMNQRREMAKFAIEKIDHREADHRHQPHGSGRDHQLFQLLPGRRSRRRYDPAALLLPLRPLRSAAIL